VNPVAPRPRTGILNLFACQREVRMFRNRQYFNSSIRLRFAVILLVAATSTMPAQVIIQKAVIGPVPADSSSPVSTALSDDDALKAARLAADRPEELLNYFRLRTLTDTDLSRIQSLIQRLGDDNFDERLKAARELERFGPAAVGPLRAARNHNDPEIAYRAIESLKRVETVPHSAVARAAARALGRLKPPGTVEILLKFLPLADDEQVAEEIRKTLINVAVRDGKADPTLLQALHDPLPIRRAAAAIALIEGGPATPGILPRIPDAYPAILAAVQKETDIETRFQMLFSLLTVAKERQAIPQLIAALPDLPRGRLWQAEDFLLQIAGDSAPKATFGKSKESLEKARDAWKTWWERSAPQITPEQLAYTPRIAGKTLLVMMDFRYGSMGEIIELGPDMKQNWKITGLNSPMDIQTLPDGNVVIAEHNSNRVTIRDPKTGQILATRRIGGANRVYGNPQQVQILPNGNLLVICRNVIVEFKKDRDEEIMRFVRNNYDITAAKRLDDGHTVVLLQNGPNHCIFLNEKGQEVKDRTLKIQMPYYQAYIDIPGKDSILLTEMNRVVEYQLSTGKQLWSWSVNQPRSVQRLPNGNTLLVDAQTNKVIEVTPSGEEVWSYIPTSGLNVFRAFRR